MADRRRESLLILLLGVYARQIKALALFCVIIETGTGKTLLLEMAVVYKS